MAEKARQLGMDAQVYPLDLARVDRTLESIAANLKYGQYPRQLCRNGLHLLCDGHVSLQLATSFVLKSD